MTPKTCLLPATIVVLCSAILAQSTANLDWEMDQNPPPRTNFALAHHVQMGITVLYGGGVQNEAYDDTWTWDGQWRRFAGGLVPPGRFLHAMAYDSTRARIILFGGSTTTFTTNYLNDTWSFDANGWTKLAPVASPPPLRAHMMAYDAARDRVIVLGGQVSGQQSTVMWEFDGTTWAANAGGSGSASGSIVYDAAHQELLNLANGGMLRAFDGISWQPRSNAGVPITTSGPMIYDSSTQRVLLMLPQAVYAWSGISWSLVGTPFGPQATLRHCFDDTRQRILGVALPLAENGLQGGTWLLESNVWQNVAPRVPRGRAFAGLAYDTLRHRTILHGGGVGLERLHDVLELEERTWFVGAVGQPGPTQRSRHTLVYDESRDVSVVFGGESLFANNVLEYDSSGTWGGSSPSFAPAGRRLHSATYDSLRSRMLVFGGESTQPVLNDLWSWNGLTWSNLTPASSPPPRRAAAMSYDRDRDRVVLFGGTNGTTSLSDTWEFDGVAWTQMAPGAAPPPRSAHVQVYDSHLHRTIVFGGANSQQLHDTWTWDGVTWMQMATTHAPEAGEGACGVYDPDRRELILFGGAPARGEVWRLRDTRRGSWESAGFGCDTGNGVLSLSAVDPLVIGGAARLELTNIPDIFAVLPIAWVGFDNQQWGSIPLPVSLDVLGSPDCLVWADPVVALWLVNDGGGVASGQLVLPYDPSFVDDVLYLQGMSWDFVLPRIATANLLIGRIGVP